jgi:hypothetical protein
VDIKAADTYADEIDPRGHREGRGGRETRTIFSN